MRKLEEILHVEDSARDAVAHARAEAERIAREAAMEADEIRHAARRHAAHEARILRENALEAAREDAVRIESEAAATLDTTLAAAKVAVPDAVAAIVRELTE